MGATRGIDRLGLWNRDAVLPLLADEDNPTIVVVGNGPLQADICSEVEAATVVVRFNNWATRRGLEPQHSLSGDVCDILVSNFDIHNEEWREAKQVVLAIPWPHHAADAPALLERFYPDADPRMTNPWWMQDCAQAIDCKYPTVGLTALYCLHRMALPATFKVYGFTWHYDAQQCTIQGMPLDARQRRKAWRHHYPMEARWVGENLWGRPNWHFDAPAAEALDAVMAQCWPWLIHQPL